MVQVYLAWLKLLGVGQDRWRLRVSIHESADVCEAERYWVLIAGVPVDFLRRATLKRHNPRTTRKNIGIGYHGCLTISVLRSADLYRRIEGWWMGIADTQGGADSGRV
ncbi:hypothetical protein [Kitasatospora cathayae]|uniref:hypothetical protein n=1 Tax=Kitasatospora cathayae TaxID=3004092 RepID=UPI002FD86438